MLGVMGITLLTGTNIFSTWPWGFARELKQKGKKQDYQDYKNKEAEFVSDMRLYGESVQRNLSQAKNGFS